MGTFRGSPDPVGAPFLLGVTEGSVGSRVCPEGTPQTQQLVPHNLDLGGLMPRAALLLLRIEAGHADAELGLC